MHPSRKRTRALRVYITPFTFLFSPSSKSLATSFFWNYLVKNYAKIAFLCPDSSAGSHAKGTWNMPVAYPPRLRSIRG